MQGCKTEFQDLHIYPLILSASVRDSQPLFLKELVDLMRIRLIKSIQPRCICYHS